GIHNRTVRDTPRLFIGPDLPLAKAAVGVDRIAIDNAVQCVCAEKAVVRRAPEQSVGDAQVAEQLPDLAAGVDSEQATGASGYRKVATLGVEIVLHAPQPESSALVATCLVGAITRGWVRDAKQVQV